MVAELREGFSWLIVNETMANHLDDSHIPYFNGLPQESLEEYKCDVEAYVHGTKADDMKLCGPSLLRRLGGIPGALERRELKAPDLAKDEGYQLIFGFLE